MSLPMAQPMTRFHLSLNVGELARSVAFYRVLFGAEPAKCHDDYAKFEVDEPPVVFSLVPRPPSAGWSLSHAGLRLPDAAALEAMRQRLEGAGLAVQVQDCTTCGYARQSKCWVVDPDGLHWEIYVLEEDVDPASIRRSVEGPAARQTAPSGPVVWEHCVSHPLPEAIPASDDSADEVRLIGSFNSDLTLEQLRRLVSEARRVLKPGGKLFLHALLADAPLPGAAPELPQVASMVRRVPDFAEPLDLLGAAGFVGTHFVKCSEQPWFRHEGIGLREVQLTAVKPQAEEGAQRLVVYKGPFAQARADGEQVFRRGERTAVTTAVWDLLRQGDAAEQFLFLDPDAPATGACG
jgi:catechol 2,3-dioxygenase-like lactoylglutathione lyase family enzyme